MCRIVTKQSGLQLTSSIQADPILQCPTALGDCFSFFLGEAFALDIHQVVVPRLLCAGVTVASKGLNIRVGAEFGIVPQRQTLVCVPYMGPDQFVRCLSVIGQADLRMDPKCCALEQMVQGLGHTRTIESALRSQQMRQDVITTRFALL